MKEFLQQNPWAIGVGGGVIGGFIIFFLTRWLINVRDNKEYLKTIELANGKVIETLIPYISDKGLPTIDVLNSIIATIAREYRLKVREMYSTSIICEELICGILSNFYVSNDKKEEYMNQLSKYKNELTSKETESRDKEFLVRARAESAYRRRLNKQYSLLVSFASMFLIAGVMIFIVNIDKSLRFAINNCLIIYALVVSSCLLPIILVTIFGERLRVRREIKNNIDYGIDESKKLNE